MKKRWLGIVLMILFSLLGATAAWAPPPAQNPNLQERVETLETYIAALQGQIGILQTAAENLEVKTAYTTVKTGELVGLKEPHVIFESVNVHIRSGSGLTDNNTDNDQFPGTGDPDVFTELGNLIIGYNEEAIGVPYEVPEDNRAGSRNLIVRSKHSYTSYGCFLASSGNMASKDMASVSGGSWNVASGFFASILGGRKNLPTG